MNVSELSVENRSPALDDDSRVLVLRTPAVTFTFRGSRFSGTPSDCSLVSFSPQQTLVELSLAVFAVVAAVEKSYQILKMMIRLYD